MTVQHFQLLGQLPPAQRAARGAPNFSLRKAEGLPGCPGYGEAGPAAPRCREGRRAGGRAAC